MGLTPPRLLPLTLTVLALLTGCSTRTTVSPDRIIPDPHASGDNQCAMYGATLPAPLRVVVEGAHEPGVLGGKGSRRPVPGAEVVFEIEDPESGAVFADNAAATFVTTTTVAGTADAWLTLGQRPGDIIVLASVRTPGGGQTIGPVLFRACAGMELRQSQREGRTGSTIDEVGVRLFNPDGTSAEGVDVYFHVEGNGEGAVLGKEWVRTDGDGYAITSWRLGKKIQQYFIRAEIADRRPHVPLQERFGARAFRFEAMAINKVRMATVLVGGLAIFIYGMHLMSSGLRRMADRRLRAILQAMTRNRFLATGVGAGLTAMMQSSSAVTVMVVGFVNAGLMTLPQSIGVVLGANIGTTITAQIIAFSLEAVALPAIAVGGIVMALGRKLAVKSLGQAILGFGLLFLGMTTMSGVLKPLQYSPEFQAYFQMFECSPVNGVVPAGAALMCILIGTVATMIVQSSSATVALVLALSSQGLLSFYTAIPLVLGQNIGTTITALFAAIGTNRNAKRAALAHTLFNVSGAAYMYVLLFLPLWNGQPVFLSLIDAITPGNPFGAAPENLMRHVANAHTVFNTLTCLLFLPFVGTLAHVCHKIIPLTDADRESILEYLEPKLLETPSLALQQAIQEVAYMVRRAQKSINDGCELFYGSARGPRDVEAKILAREDLIDRLQHEITAYLVELSRHNLLPAEAALIPALIHAVNDAERIGDHSENLVELTHLKESNKHKISAEAMADIRKLHDLLNDQFDATYIALVEGDPDAVDRAVAQEDEITAHVATAAEAHVRRLENKQCEVQAGVIFLDLLAHLERVGDHLLNIAERAGRIIKETRP